MRIGTLIAILGGCLVAACGGGGEKDTGDGTVRLPTPLSSQPTYQATSIVPTLPAKAVAADFVLSSSAASAPAVAGTIPTLPRDIVSLTRNGQPVFIAAVRGTASAPIAVNAESTALALVMIRLQMGAATEEKYVQVSNAVRVHPRFPALTAAIETAARAGMTRPLDVHANPLLGLIISQIAEAVASTVISNADTGLPRWLASALFRAMPGSAAWAKDYSTTSAGGEVAVVASGGKLKIQNFRAVPWMVAKADSSDWGVAAGRQNGLAFGNPVTAWPVTWESFDWGKLVSEGSTESEVTFTAAGLSGTGKEILHLRTYTVGHLAIDVLKDAATSTISANDGLGTRALTLLVGPLRSATTKYTANPELAEATLLNLLDGVAILSSIGADGKLTDDRRLKLGKGRALVTRLSTLAETFEQAPCWVATAKPAIKGSAALVSGVRDGLESRSFGNGSTGQQMAMNVLIAASDSLQHLDASISALSSLVPECTSQTTSADSKRKFWANLGSGWADAPIHRN